MRKSTTCAFCALDNNTRGVYSTDNSQNHHFNCPASDKGFRYITGPLQYDFTGHCPNCGGISDVDSLYSFIQELSWQLRTLNSWTGRVYLARKYYWLRGHLEMLTTRLSGALGLMEHLD